MKWKNATCASPWCAQEAKIRGLCRRHYRVLRKDSAKVGPQPRDFTLDDLRCKCAKPEPEHCRIAGRLIEPAILQCSYCLHWIDT